MDTKQTSSNLLVVVLLVLFAAGIFFFLVMPKFQNGKGAPNAKQVSNFKECAAAGNPVMESYPRQCRNGGDVFVEEIDASELANAAIQSLFVEKYPKYADTLSVSIDKLSENHARGSVIFVQGEPGGIFLAAKVDSKWQIVFDGNGTIPCDLSKYDFPAEMLSDCN